MIELLTAAALSSSTNEKENEAADHNRGGERTNGEERGENCVELMNKLLVLRPFLRVAEVAIFVVLVLVVVAALAVLRPSSFALRSSSRCWPLGGGRRRRRRCCRRRRWAKARVISRSKKKCRVVPRKYFTLSSWSLSGSSLSSSLWSSSFPSSLLSSSLLLSSLLSSSNLPLLLALSALLAASTRQNPPKARFYQCPDKNTPGAYGSIIQCIENN